MNGIDVARFQLKEQDSRSDLFSRMYDGITSQGARRQSNINARLTDAIEGSRQWLMELTAEQASTNKVVAQHGLALARITDAVGKLSDHLASVARDAATRTELKRLAKEVDSRLGKVEAWVVSIEAKIDAKVDLDRVISKWQAGRYQGLSILGQCYVALEELRWGAFGYYCQTHSADSMELLKTLEYKAMKQMSMVAGGLSTSVDERIKTAAWLQQPEKPLLDGAEALAYLGEDHAPGLPPFVSVVTQNPPTERWPGEVPHIMSASRAASALVGEIFKGQNQSG